MRVGNSFGSHDECKNVLGIPFNSDLLGRKSLEMSCSGIPWICSWTSEFCGSWPKLCWAMGWYCEAFKVAPPQNSWLCPMQQS